MEANEGEREAQERLVGLNAVIAYYDRLTSVLEALKILAENEKFLELRQRIIEEIARAKASKEEFSRFVPPLSWQDSSPGVSNAKYGPTSIGSRC
jgi:hypothetical protein